MCGACNSQGTSPAEWEDHAQEGGVAGRLQTQRRKEEFFIHLQISKLASEIEKVSSNY